MRNRCRLLMVLFLVILISVTVSASYVREDIEIILRSPMGVWATEPGSNFYLEAKFENSILNVKAGADYIYHRFYLLDSSGEFHLYTFDQEFLKTGQYVSMIPNVATKKIEISDDIQYVAVFACDDRRGKPYCNDGKWMVIEMPPELITIEGYVEIIRPYDNRKNMSKYTAKEAFLISDKDWRDVLTLVPLTTWTGGKGCQGGYGTPDNVCLYSSLIYHEEETAFDADSIIHFMQQYGPNRVTIIGDTPIGLDELLIADPKLGAGLDPNQLQKIYPNDYFSYWESYKDIVYVDKAYENALIASAYASLINAPLIIQDYNDDFELSEKNVICVGKISSEFCDQTYNKKQLQKVYLENTHTDKLILVNRDDLDIFYNASEMITIDRDIDPFIEVGLEPEKSSGELFTLYNSQSMAAPFLASAKHELILDVASSDYRDVSTFLNNSIVNEFRFSPKYLTIMAPPNAIQMSKDSDRQLFARPWREEVDNHIYGNFDEDPFQDLAVGRIFSLTLSDVSSYLARDLFNHEIIKSNEFVTMWPAPPGNFWNMKTTSIAIEDIFEEMGFTSVSFLTDENIPPQASDFENKMMLSYTDHAWTTGGAYNFNTPEFNENQIWLNSPLVFMEGCGSCAFNLSGSSKKDLFCANLLRRGALMHYGATVDASASNFDPAKMLVEEALVSNTIGDAVKIVRNKIIPFKDAGEADPYDQWDVLIGDPTFNPSLRKPIYSSSGNSALEEITVSFKPLDEVIHVIDIEIPESKKDVRISYDEPVYDWHHEVDLFSYPFGPYISRAYRFNSTTYNLSTGGKIINFYSDSLYLTFTVDMPETYKITSITKVEYINQTDKIEIKSMPVFETIYSWQGTITEPGELISYRADLPENKYYFFFPIIYGGGVMGEEMDWIENPYVVEQDTIPEHTFRIYLDIEEVNP